MRIRELPSAEINVKTGSDKIYFACDQENGQTGKIDLTELSKTILYEGQDLYLKDIKVPDAATVHNQIFRGKKVELPKMIASIQGGSFDDLYIGDYFELTLPSEQIEFTNDKVNEGSLTTPGTIDKGNFTFNSGTCRFIILGFDNYMYNGDMESAYANGTGFPSGCTCAFASTPNGDMKITKHHAVVCPALPLFTAGMGINLKNDTTLCYNIALEINNKVIATAQQANGYLGCRLRNSVFPKVREELDKLICAGSNNKGHILTYRDVFGGLVADSNSSVVNSQKMPTSFWWTFADVELLNEVEVFGTNVFGNGYDVGIAKTQLPYFRLCNGARENSYRQTYWLRNVASSVHFSSVHDNGYAYCWIASRAFGVRPRFLIG